MKEDIESREPLLPANGIKSNTTVNYETISGSEVVPYINVSGDHDSNKKEWDIGTIKVYKRRWYVLIMFNLYSFLQNAVWNTWGPISTTSKEAFGWTNATVAWLNNWGPVSYILTGLFFPWLLQVKGLRCATLTSMAFIALGTILRVFTSEPGTATILIHIGQFMNGVAGPIGMGAMPYLSAAWFPPKQRVTATAIGTSLSVFGGALPYVIGPALVPSGPPDVNMTTLNTNSSSHHTPHTPEPFNVTEARIYQERKEIMLYMYYECGVSVLLFIIMLIYFPAKPPHPPCISATVERVKYWPGLWSLRKKGYFLIVAMSYGVSVGVLNCWSSVINMNLEPFKISEDTSGWIGFYSTVAACIGSLFIGRFADMFARRMKLFILVMYILGLACFVVFALMLLSVIKMNMALLYFTIIGGTTLINAAVPLMYEVACELAYPTSESAANGLLTYFNNFWGLVFLGMFSIKQVADNKMWMNWTVIVSIAVCIPLVAVLKSRFKRLELDEGVDPESVLKQEIDVPNEYTIQAH